MRLVITPRRLQVRKNLLPISSPFGGNRQVAITGYAHSSRAGAAAVPLLFPQSPEARKPAAPDRDQCRLRKQLDSILKVIKIPVTEEAVRDVFNTLSRLREIMRLVELNVGEGGPTQVTLAAFAFAESESRSLVRFIETRAPKIKSAKWPLREALAGMCFALRHEMKTVFGHDLAGITAERRPDEVRPDFMRAHGLLSNCFQQSIITLARVFDPSVRGELLFDDYRARFKQSSVLLRELLALARLARRAGENPDAEASDLLIRELKGFCQGTLYYLMYKDWDEFEDIAGEVRSSQGSARHGFILHCFATYLEALVNQVRMRSVLSDQSPASTESKPLKKSPKGRR